MKVPKISQSTLVSPFFTFSVESAIVICSKIKNAKSAETNYCVQKKYKNSNFFIIEIKTSFACINWHRRDIMDYSRVYLVCKYKNLFRINRSP